jgi:ABC-type transport system involved in multi-copper enzyme maturation permease subunit
MLLRILRVTGIEFFKLARRRAAWLLVAVLLLIVFGQGVGARLSVESQRDRTRELNGYLVFAEASDTGLFVAGLLLVLYASAAFAGETSLGTLKGLLIRPVTRTEFVLGKALALSAMALGLGAVVLAAAAAVGGVLSDYGGVVQIAHNERTTGLLAGEYTAEDDPDVPRLDDLRRLGFTGRWDDRFAALRIGKVLPDGLAAQRDVREGDIVTHAAVEGSPPARLKSLEHWRRWTASLPEDAVVSLTLDAPIVTQNHDYPESYVLRQTGRALLLVPLPLIAMACFGLLWSSLVENLGMAVGGSLLSVLAVRFVAGALIVGLLRAVTGREVFASNVEPWLFTTHLALPMARLRGTASATANMRIEDKDVHTALAVCGATIVVCLAVSLWRFRRKDVLG